MKPSVFIREIRGSIQEEKNESMLDKLLTDADQFVDRVGVEFSL